MAREGVMNEIQWPAMILTVLAAWLVTYQTKRERQLGFWCFLGSNALWTVWGIAVGASAIVVLQMALGMINLWGAYKTSRPATDY